MSEVDVVPVPSLSVPRLHSGREGMANRAVLRLAYVLVVLELAKVLYEDLTCGAAVLAGSFVTIWFSWVGFTLYANRFDTDDVVFRIAKLIATGSIAGCAASASDAAAELAVPFAACYLGDHSSLCTSGPGGTFRRPWPTVGVYLLTVGLSAALWAVSLVVPSPSCRGRSPCWYLRRTGAGHSTVGQDSVADRGPPERFALPAILVLGEAVGSAARGVHDALLVLFSIGVGVLGFAVVAASGGFSLRHHRAPTVPESCMFEEEEAAETS